MYAVTMSGISYVWWNEYERTNINKMEKGRDGYFLFEFGQ